MVDQLDALDPRDELRIEAEDPVETQHVGNEVVGEHRPASVQVVELGDRRSVQGQPPRSERV